MWFRDLYDIVGVHAEATPQNIRTAADEHPFLAQPDSVAAARVRAAKDILLDPELRRIYDRLRPIMDYTRLHPLEAERIDMGSLDRQVAVGSVLQIRASRTLRHLELCLDGQVVLVCRVAVAAESGRWVLMVTEVRPQGQTPASDSSPLGE